MAGRFPEAEVFEIGPEGGGGPDIRNPTVFAGFVGAGLVGPLAVGYMIEKLGMREVGYMRSSHLPPSTVFIRGRLRHPFRFCASGDGSICAVICEVTLRMDGLYSMVSTILDWAESKGSTEIAILDGVASDDHDDRAYGAAEVDMCRVMEDRDISMIPQGFITGVPGGILNECLLRRIRGVTLLAKANKSFPDPLAAATIVEAVNRLYELDISTDGLRRERDRIGDDFMDMSQKYAEHRKELSGMYM